LQRDAVKCWGRAIDGVLGDVAQDSAVPMTVLSGGITALVSGYNHVCAIQNGALKCWGFNAFGQLGHDQNFGSISEGVKTPITVPGLGSGVTRVVAGEDHTCALQGDTMRCWGSNAFGELGRQTTESRTYLPDITLNTGVSQVFAGGLHTCAVHNGDLKCWGANYDRQLGNTSTEGILRTPTLVTSITGTFEALYLGGSNTCVTQNGATSCWGSGDDGIMQGAARTHLPVSIYADDTTAFAIGESHMCGAQQAALSCWGSNWAGQTGNPATAGEFVDGPTPYFINFQ
jgi:alpha-tubulin suppressor-like RCC1 family protein